MTLGVWKTGSPRRTIYVDYNSIKKKVELKDQPPNLGITLA